MSDIRKALSKGDPQTVAEMIVTGANIRYKAEHGYDALIDAVHGRDVARDPRLLELLQLLISSDVDLSGVTSYNESGLRVLSHWGRFDGVRMLLESGADRSHLEWTPLMDAVCLGTIDDVEAAILAGSPLEDRDRWSRTAYLLALMAGDVDKPELLLAHGANSNVCGWCDVTPLMLAIHAHHPHVVRWLIGCGADVDQPDEFGRTPLTEAADRDDIECLELLLAAGANVNHKADRSALSQASSPAIALRLLVSGADPQTLPSEARRSILGLQNYPAEGQMTATPAEFARAPRRTFGRTNPEHMDEPFWEALIRSGISASQADDKFGASVAPDVEPIWCAERFGQSLTILPDGRIIEIGGEHEDWYDPNFCIYNDVFVHGPNGQIRIFGYPDELFPPTDFHTATLLGTWIYIIGRLGYAGTRQYGETPVYRLDVNSLRIERVATHGHQPGWIFKHRADIIGPREIRISGGQVASWRDGKEVHCENDDSFVLTLDDMEWRRLAQ